jgi:hypothetical protein
MMRRGRWLLLALILFVAAVLMMRTGEEPPLRPKEVRLERIPTLPTHEEIERSAGRRTLEVRRSLLDGVELREEAEKRDPFLIALAPKGETAVVIELNAIRHSPLGEMLIACMDERMRKDLDELKTKYDFDPLQDLDRLGVVDGGGVVSGELSKVAEEMKKGSAIEYGEHGLISMSESGKPIALWRNEMLMFGQSEEEIRAQIDQLEGRAPPVEPTIGENMAYGEVYGRVGARFITKLLPPDPELEKLLEAARQIELHVHTDQSVAASLRLTGDDPKVLDELARTIGGAMATARVAAASGDDEELAMFLESAAVNRRTDDGFSIELAVPFRWVRSKLGDCANAVELP